MQSKLPLAILLMSLASFAQTTNTYTVAASVSGVYSTPFRAFSIPLTQGAEVNWIEVGPNTACSGQTLPAVGFIFLTLPTGGALPCASLTGSPSPTQGSFTGVDNNGVPYSGTYSFTMTEAYKCSGGRGGGCHMVFTITGGQVTINQ